jgi:hypothetical protein
MDILYHSVGLTEYGLGNQLEKVSTFYYKKFKYLGRKIK